MGRDRTGKSHRNAVAQGRDGRARDARADLLEARLPRTDALARERADDLHPGGRAEVPDRRRGGHRARRRAAAHPVVGRAPGRSARGYIRARRVQPDSPGLARSHRRLFPPLKVAGAARDHFLPNGLPRADRARRFKPHSATAIRNPRSAICEGGLVMGRFRVPVLAFCAATAGVAWLSAASGPGSGQGNGPARIRGFSAASSAAEAAREREMKASPSPKLAEADFDVMTAEPHHTGSPYEIKLADYVAGALKSFGLDATKYEYSVLLPWPGQRRIDIVAPDPITLQVEEEKIRGDQWADKPGILPAYNAYSPSGEVTGELVYVNYGIPADYETLAKLGIDVKGKIVLARYGGSWRGIKPKVAAEHGAIACIIYSDPHEDGYFQGDVYPDGPFRGA